jgi:hypothetical protein
VSGSVEHWTASMVDQHEHMGSWAAMRHDLLPLGPMTWREQVMMWIEHYWWPTRRWVPKVERWWAYKVRGYPPPPPFAADKVAHHLGFVDGIPACTDTTQRCAAHGFLMSLGDDTDD